jgi:hypothetical protein
MWHAMNDSLPACFVLCLKAEATSRLRAIPQEKLWRVPALSSVLRANLQVLDVSDNIGLISIKAVRKCEQLRCLRMSGVGVGDLSPLAACSQLEELWMAGAVRVSSLAPLKACSKLRKLDLRGCFQLRDVAQVEDLQLSCTLLANPSSVALEGLVHELQPSMSPFAQSAAASVLAKESRKNAANKVAVADAGAIPPLVKLLGLQSSSGVQTAVARALSCLAVDHVQNRAAIVAAGAVPLLVQLRSSQVERVHVSAADALHVLGFDE